MDVEKYATALNFDFVLIETNNTALIYVLFCIMIVDSDAHEKLTEALEKPSLIKGVKQASPEAQTSCLEGYHSVVNQFAPKMFAYSYLGMLSR